jgi:hypothetical protein
MRNPFKQQGPTKAQKKEAQRRWKLTEEVIYPILLEDCKSVHDMRRRLQCVVQAIDYEIANKVSELKKQTLGTWGIKAMEGKGDRVEQDILNVLENETLESAHDILNLLPKFIETFIDKEMSERSPDSLKVTFPR